MRIILEDRFLRSCLSRSPADREGVFDALLGLDKALGDPHQHSGRGLRKLHPSGIWEVRAGLGLRAVFTVRSDTATFLFLGTHDELKRFLRGL